MMELFPIKLLVFSFLAFVCKGELRNCQLASKTGGDATTFCNMDLLGGGWTAYLIDGSGGQYKSTLRAGQNAGGIGKWYSSSPTETTPQMTGYYKMSEALFNSYGFNEVVAVIGGSGVYSGNWQRIRTKSGNVITAAQAFSVGGAIPTGETFIMDHGKSDGKVISTIEKASTESYDKTHGPFFHDEWGQPYNWMWTDHSGAADTRKGTIPGASKSDVALPWIWYGRHDRSWDLATKISPSIDKYGFDVDLSESYAIVSKVYGTVWIYGKATDGTGDWDKDPLLVIDKYASVGGFGHAVAITENFAIVGAQDAKQAFVFARDDSTGWSGTAVATFSESASRFGIDVAMTDNFAIVGADYGAAAYIYARDPDTGKWGTTPVTSITGYNAVVGEGGFGWSVSITDSYAMVGSWGQGKAFVFAREDKEEYIQHGCTIDDGCKSGSLGVRYDYRPPNVGTAAQGISIFDTCAAACVKAGYGYFGLECPMSTATHCQCYSSSRIESRGLSDPSTKSCKDTLAHCSNTATLSYDGVTYELGGHCIGSVYAVKKKVTKKLSFSSTAATIIDGYTQEKGFAAAVYLSDKYAMVGTGRNHPGLTYGAANKAYIFELNTATSTWPKTALTVLDGYTSEQAFGFDVAINDNWAIVGAYFANKVFVFGRGEDGKWMTTAKSILQEQKSISFGWSVSLSSEKILVGSGSWVPNCGSEAYFWNYIDDSRAPTSIPTAVPTSRPTAVPTSRPTAIPTARPTAIPTARPTTRPTAVPTPRPTPSPTTRPTFMPTPEPTAAPTPAPSVAPSQQPTPVPTPGPTLHPTPWWLAPTAAPSSVAPTPEPTFVPTATPTFVPTATPSTAVPPSSSPTVMASGGSGDAGSVLSGGASGQSDESTGTLVLILAVVVVVLCCAIIGVFYYYRRKTKEMENTISQIGVTDIYTDPEAGSNNSGVNPLHRASGAASVGDDQAGLGTGRIRIGADMEEESVSNPITMTIASKAVSAPPAPSHPLAATDNVEGCSGEDRQHREPEPEVEAEVEVEGSAEGYGVGEGGQYQYQKPGVEEPSESHSFSKASRRQSSSTKKKLSRRSSARDGGGDAMDKNDKNGGILYQKTPLALMPESRNANDQ